MKGGILLEFTDGSRCDAFNNRHITLLLRNIVSDANKVILNQMVSRSEFEGHRLNSALKQRNTFILEPQFSTPHNSQRQWIHSLQKASSSTSTTTSTKANSKK